jgi:hypothetical protein
MQPEERETWLGGGGGAKKLLGRLLHVCVCVCVWWFGPISLVVALRWTDDAAVARPWCSSSEAARAT